VVALGKATTLPQLRPVLLLLLLCQYSQVPGCSSLLPDVVDASDCIVDDSSSASSIHHPQAESLQLNVNAAKHTFGTSVLLPHCK
jgi:hypothetical protein